MRRHVAGVQSAMYRVQVHGAKRIRMEAKLVGHGIAALPPGTGVLPFLTAATSFSGQRAGNGRAGTIRDSGRYGPLS